MIRDGFPWGTRHQYFLGFVGFEELDRVDFRVWESVSGIYMDSHGEYVFLINDILKPWDSGDDARFVPAYGGCLKIRETYVVLAGKHSVVDGLGLIGCLDEIEKTRQFMKTEAKMEAP